MVLSDLSASSGDPGRWFAAAKDAGFLDLALDFARSGHTDPRTLSRASRDLLGKDAQFSLEAGRLALRLIVKGDAYEIMGMDAMDACRHFLAAARSLGVASQARAEIRDFVAEHPGNFSEILIHLCSADVQDN
jgi:hypothetical protein